MDGRGGWAWVARGGPSGGILALAHRAKPAPPPVSRGRVTGEGEGGRPWAHAAPPSGTRGTFCALPRTLASHSSSGTSCHRPPPASPPFCARRSHSAKAQHVMRPLLAPPSRSRSHAVARACARSGRSPLPTLAMKIDTFSLTPSRRFARSQSFNVALHSTRPALTSPTPAWRPRLDSARAREHHPPDCQHGVTFYLHMRCPPSLLPRAQPCCRFCFRQRLRGASRKFLTLLTRYIRFHVREACLPTPPRGVRPLFSQHERPAAELRRGRSAPVTSGTPAVRVKRALSIPTPLARLHRPRARSPRTGRPSASLSAPPHNEARAVGPCPHRFRRAQSRQSRQEPCRLRRAPRCAPATLERAPLPSRRRDNIAQLSFAHPPDPTRRAISTYPIPPTAPSPSHLSQAANLNPICHASPQPAAR